MGTDLRINDILTFLNKKKRASNQELCEKLHCSISTLRRDLLKLEQQGLIKRTHGGAILVASNNVEYSHLYRETTNIAEKKLIADLAKDFIGPNMCLYLDSSSTVQQLCPIIKDIPNLIVITNGLKTALELSNENNETLKIFICGGEIKNNSSSVISDNIETIFQSFQFNLAFLSCRGIDENGVYEANFSQANVKKKMMQQAKQTVLLADHTKFNSSHFFKIGDLQDYDAIITNQPPDNTFLETLKQTDTELLY